MAELKVTNQMAELKAIVADFDLPLAEREEAVAELKTLPTGSTSVCTKWQRSFFPADLTCVKEEDVPVYGFRGGPASPDSFILKFSEFFGDGVVQRARENLSKTKPSSEKTAVQTVGNWLMSAFELRSRSLEMERKWCQEATGFWNRHMACLSYFTSRKPMP